MKIRQAFSIIPLLLMTVILFSGCGIELKEDDGTNVNVEFEEDGSIDLSVNDEPGFTLGLDENDNITVTASEPDESDETTEAAEDIIILYTNDVHCSVDDNIGYDGLSAYKKELESAGYPVLLADAGDHIQGGSIGSISKGDSVINLMNKVGYDVSTIGNHEFDYGIDKLLELRDMAEFPYVCCNFKDSKTGKFPYDPYTILEAGGKKIAFIGVVTPNTITSSTPEFFIADDGSRLYDFSETEGEKAFYETVQKAADDARSEGADYCIVLSHLGINDSDTPYKSGDLIKNTTGIDVVLDAHSHSVVEMEKVKNADGNSVILTQTGSNLKAIGKLTIDKAGNIKTELITDYEKKDPEITKAIVAEQDSFKDILDEVVAESDFGLYISDEDNNRLVRNTETNLGDFVADAYRYATGADVAVANGGSIRTEIEPGEITYEDLLNVNPFSNTLVKVKVKGQDIADALEYGLSGAPEEFGGFLQVSGIEFTVDLNNKPEIILDENNAFVSVGDGDRRVSDIKINGKALDPDKDYTVGGISYMLQDGGDGHTALNGEDMHIGFITDVDGLALYIKEGLKGKIPEEYSDRYGQGRITFK